MGKYNKIMLIKRDSEKDGKKFYILLIECIQNWKNDLKFSDEDITKKFKKKCFEIEKLNLIDSIDEFKETEYNFLEDLLFEKIDSKSNNKIELSNEELEMKKDLDVMKDTLQELKIIFIKFLETADTSLGARDTYNHMLKEMKSLYNNIIGKVN